MLKNSYISGLGMNVPDNIIKNSDLSEYMDTSDEWIYERLCDLGFDKEFA